MPLRWDTRALASLTKFSDARIYMDFANGVYFGRSPSDLSVTRAGTSLVPDASGALTSFSANALRRVPNLGVWTEEGRTNLALQSQTATVSPWTTTAITTAADVTTAPDGTTTAESILETVASSQHSINQTGVTASASVAYIISCYIKPIGGRNAHIQVNRADAARPFNGYIKRFAYWPTRLPNATLQALTA